MAKGYSQKPRIDYSETYAPVVRMDSLRFLVTIVAYHHLHFHTIDIKGTYLNAILNEEIYLVQPPGFEDGTKHIWKLLKSLYGLKQAGREWNTLLNKAFTKMKFRKLMADQCVFIRGSGKDLLIVGVHVD